MKNKNLAIALLASLFLVGCSSSGSSTTSNSHNSSGSSEIQDNEKPIIEVFAGDIVTKEIADFVSLPSIIVKDNVNVGLAPLLRLTHKNEDVSIVNNGFAPLGLGEYSLSIKAIDGAGNLSDEKIIKIVLVDSTQPVISPISTIYANDHDDLVIPTLTVSDYFETTLSVKCLAPSGSEVVLSINDANKQIVPASSFKKEGPGTYKLEFIATEKRDSPLSSLPLIVSVVVSKYGSLDDFENEADRNRLSIVEGVTPTTVNLSEEYHTSGSKSLEVHMTKSVNHVDNWPNFGFGGSSLAYTDWTAFKAIAFDIYNVSEGKMTLAATLIDGNGKKQDGTPYDIEPNEKKTLTWKLKSFSGISTWSSISQVYFYQNNFWDFDRHFYIDNIRLLDEIETPSVLYSQGFEKEDDDMIGRIRYQGSSIALSHNSDASYTANSSKGSLKVNMPAATKNDNYLLFYSTNATSIDQYFSFGDVETYDFCSVKIFNASPNPLKYYLCYQDLNWKPIKGEAITVPSATWSTLILSLADVKAGLVSDSFRVLEIHVDNKVDDVFVDATFYLDDLKIYKNQE